MQKLPNIYSVIAQYYLSACNLVCLSEESAIVSMDGILDTLTTVKRRPGLVYEIYTPSTMHGMGGTCICYGREGACPIPVEYWDQTSMRPQIEYPKGCLPIWKALDWTFTPLGIWEWILIEDLWRNLPLFWHANYCKVDYIFDKETYRCVVPDIVERYLTPTGRPRKGYREDIEKLAKAYRKKNGEPMFGRYGFKSKEDLFAAIELTSKVDKELAPHGVEIDEKTIEMSFAVWNDWCGLKKITYRAEPMKRRGYPRLVRIEDKLLVKYNCGICF